MKGKVDSGGRSLLSIELRSTRQASPTQVDVWIDTAFTGDLVIPKSLIDVLGLLRSGSIDAILADGTMTELNTYSCIIEWSGTDRSLEVIANDGAYPLLGVDLLLGLELWVDYCNFQLTLSAAEQEIT